MKKKILLIFTVMFWLGSQVAYSQEDGGQGGGGNAITVELAGTPFIGDNIPVTPSFFKVRYFINDQIAARVSTWFSFSSDQVVPETSMNKSYFSARPGVEYHLATDPGVYTAYVGAEIILDHQRNHLHTNVGVPVAGAWNINDIRNYDNRGFFSYGINFVGGAELYRGKSVYVGTEIGLAYSMTNHSEVRYGGELFLGRAKTSQFNIDLSRFIRVGFAINN
jgi:hypothetical protein